MYALSATVFSRTGQLHSLCQLTAMKAVVFVTWVIPNHKT